MIEIKTNDTATRVIEHFEALNGRNRARLVRALGGLTAELLSRAEGAAPHQSGKLAASLHRSVNEYDHRVVGKVWSDDPKAHTIEFGFHGSEAVKAYTRQQSVVFGRFVAPFEAMVSAYTRTEDIAPHPFMRPALGSMAPEIHDVIQTAYEGIDQS